jgi:DNA-binding PadR family transcriptional regulator
MRRHFDFEHHFGGPEFHLMRRHKGEGKGHGGRHGSRHGHRHGGFGRGFGGRGGGRFFDHGELRHVVLALLAEQPRHGYDIIRAIDERTSGAYSPSPGVIYPTLQLLEDVGHAAPATGDDARNSYQITPQGRAFLEENSALIGDIMSRMQRLGRSQASAFPAIVDAMDNLKLALRSGTEPWTEAQARAVAAAIDTAADSIRTARNPAGGAAKK